MAGGATPMGNCEIQWRPLEIGGDAGGEVTKKTPALEAVEPPRDFGFETDASRREERMAGGKSGIDHSRPALLQDVQGLGHRTVDAQVSTQAVAGPAWHEPQRSRA